MLTFTLPIRFAIEDATSIDAAEIELVTKKIVPSSPSGKLNLRWKKYVIHDLLKLALSMPFLVSAMTYRDASPDAKESIPNKINNRITSDHRSFSIDANKEFLGAGSCSTGA